MLFRSAGAGLGGPERNGLLLAEKDINAKGGINGRPIKIIVEDDASNPDTALSKANDLVFNQKVVALLGPSLTASTVAVGGVTHANKVPQIAFTGIGPAVERERKCLAHVLPPQKLNAQELNRQPQNKPPHKNAPEHNKRLKNKPLKTRLLGRLLSLLTKLKKPMRTCSSNLPHLMRHARLKLSQQTSLVSTIKRQQQKNTRTW